MMTKYLIIFSIFFLASCTGEKNQTENSKTETEQVEDKFMPTTDEVDLSAFEYVCDHCQIGSHEPGKCPCGMDYEKNPNFKATGLEDHNHDDHEHETHDH